MVKKWRDIAFEIKVDRVDDDRATLHIKQFRVDNGEVLIEHQVMVKIHDESAKIVAGINMIMRSFVEIGDVTPAVPSSIPSEEAFGIPSIGVTPPKPKE